MYFEIKITKFTGGYFYLPAVPEEILNRLLSDHNLLRLFAGDCGETYNEEDDTVSYFPVNMKREE